MSESILHLRRLRKKSQADLAKAMGTSQSAVARIESGESNITVETYERALEALDGEFFVATPPSEWRFRMRNWWDRPASWAFVFSAYSNEGDYERVLLGFERAGTRTQAKITESAMAS